MAARLRDLSPDFIDPVARAVITIYTWRKTTFGTI